MSSRRITRAVGLLIVAGSLIGCAGSGKARDGSAAAVVSCSAGTPVEGRPVRVVTTVAPITSIVANIAAGANVEIIGLVPEGTNSHTFSPPPSAAEALSRADIVIINGLGLEQPTRKLALANIPKTSALCELGTAILPESEWIYDFSFPREGGKPNPHLWTNPPMVIEYAKLIRNALQIRDPANRRLYKQNFTTFSAKIELLDKALRLASASIPAGSRKLLTYHDAYAYFAVEYDWKVIGAIQPSSFDEPTPKQVAGLIEQIKAEKVPAIFGSEVFPSKVLEQIAAETGATYLDVLRDDDLPGVPGDPEHSWLGLMRFDFVTMVKALGGDPSALELIDTSDVGPTNAVYPQ